MRFALLGSLSVANGDGAIECTGSKPRTILGLLLLNANSVVSRDRIVEALWGEHVPATVHSSLYNHITRLRRQLGAEGHERIKAVPPGYLIRVGPGELDVQVFGELRENGKRAAAAGAWRQAFEELTSALALWHDTPAVGLPELAGLEPAGAQISRLQEERLHACEGRIEAGLRLGLHRELIADITALVREHPLTEVFHQQLMRALSGSGRQAEALAAFRELRELLATELGVEPSAGSRDLHQLLLAGGPDLTPDANLTAGPAAPLVPTPRSLPAGIGDFTGRAEQVDWLLSLLTEPGEPRALVVSSIGGMGGIGKTTLAVHVGHLAGSQFPDGQLFVNLRGTSAEPLDPHDVLGGFLRQLGLAPEAVPDNTEERGALYRSLLASSPDADRARRRGGQRSGQAARPRRVGQQGPGHRAAVAQRSRRCRSSAPGYAGRGRGGGAIRAHRRRGTRSGRTGRDSRGARHLCGAPAGHPAGGRAAGRPAELASR